MRCNILLSVISSANWMILLLVPPISYPTLTSLKVQTGLLASHCQNCHLCCCGHPYLTGQKRLYTWPSELNLFCHVIFLLISFIAVFLSFLWFPAKYSILSLSKHCLLTLLIPCKYSVREKKVERYVTEIEAQGAGRLLPVSENLITNSYNWSLLYNMTTISILRTTEPLYRKDAVMFVLCDLCWLDSSAKAWVGRSGGHNS